MPFQDPISSYQAYLFGSYALGLALIAGTLAWLIYQRWQMTTTLQLIKKSEFGGNSNAQ